MMIHGEFGGGEMRGDWNYATIAGAKKLGTFVLRRAGP